MEQQIRQDFAGVSVLVTGATGGLGQAITESFATRGAQVTATGRDQSRGAAVVRGLADTNGSVTFRRCDLSSRSEVRSLIGEVTAGSNKVDVLVNNAGLTPFMLTPAVTDEDFEAAFQVNVHAPMMLVGALAPLMAARGGGAVVNVTSLAADRGLPAMGLYGATKAALASLTRSWATEFGPSGVRVNAVSPALVSHENNHHLDELHDTNAAMSPARRPGRPRDVADAVRFLAGADTRHVHGVVLPVDGGMLARA